MLQIKREKDKNKTKQHLINKHELHLFQSKQAYVFVWACFTIFIQLGNVTKVCLFEKSYAVVVQFNTFLRDFWRNSIVNRNVMAKDKDIMGGKDSKQTEFQ